MDWVLIILLLIFGGWFLVSILIQISPKGGEKDETSPEKLTPYQKYIADHTTDWQMSYQRKSLVKHKQLLTQALKSGDRVAAKVHSAMIIFGSSMMKNLAEKLRKINST